MINNPSQGGMITSGTYAGDGSANKAIPHGLGVTPKMVMIQIDSTVAHSGWIIASGHLIGFVGAASQEIKIVAVTPWTTTNFYVGDGTNLWSLNNNGNNYNWIAFS